MKKSLSKMNKTRKMVRRKVTFESKDDQELWLLARFGQSNIIISHRAGDQTSGQINYRLRLLKKELGLDESIRNRWKNGHDPLMWEVLAERRAVLLAELKEQVVPQLVHPTPETVRI